MDANNTLTLSVKEAGQRLGVGRTVAFRLAHEGVIPTIRLGRKIRVPVAALERMLSGDAGSKNGPAA